MIWIQPQAEIRWRGPIEGTIQGSKAITANSSFSELLKRVRAGDERAAEELFRCYEAQVRRVVRVRLTDPGLRRQFESADICQSVMADFFVRTALGQFELDSAEQLIKLLATMARNKLLNKVQHEQAQRRDVRRLEKLEVAEMAIQGRDETPSQIIAHRELLAAFQSRLSDDERYIARHRSNGKSWGDLALELNTTPDGLRIRFSRAIERVSEELGMESLLHE